MGELFMGWQRKVGVLTLMMALGFAAGWVRGYSSFDEFDFRSGERQMTNLISSRDGLSWLKPNYGEGQRMDDRTRWISETTRWVSESGEVVNSQLAFDVSKDFANAKWHLQWCGFHFAESEGNVPARRIRFAVWNVPYWSVTVPPTLISLWLLLARPHKSTSKKITEHKSNVGT
jgi:hypothetical protein